MAASVGPCKMVSIMRRELNLDISENERAKAQDPKHVVEDFVWSTSEHARHRAVSLWIIRCIVERHGGCVEIDSAVDTIAIEVPDEEKAACALEIEEQIGEMYH